MSGISNVNEGQCDDCQKEEKKEESLNEVQMAINDYTNDYNKNKHIVLKSKNIDADKLSEIALKRLEELHKLDSNDKKDLGKHFG